MFSLVLSLLINRLTIDNITLSKRDMNNTHIGMINLTSSRMTIYSYEQQ